MGKINDARKALLAAQMEHAVVTSVGTPAGEPGLDEGYYEVFVPGGVREFVTVQADNEDEAKAKVVALLNSKIDQMSEAPATANVEVSPDNMKIKMKATQKSVEGTE